MFSTHPTKEVSNLSNINTLINNMSVASLTNLDISSSISDSVEDEVSDVATEKEIVIILENQEDEYKLGLSCAKILEILRNMLEKIDTEESGRNDSN